jgi:Neuraminidase (sialidase)
MRTFSALAFFCIATGAAAQQQAKLEVLSQSVVFAHPSSDPYARNNFFGFNHAPSVVLLPDNRVLAAWFSGPFEASVDQLILGSFSSDGGKTWREAQVLQDFPHKSDFDPAFVTDGQRTLLFFSAGRHNRYPPVHDEKNKVGPRSFSTYLRVSDDSGRTWSAPHIAAEQVFCRSNGIRLSTGELLLPVYNLPETAGVLKSTDHGNTWKHYGSITSPAGADEPSLIELKSGEILMILRTHDGFLWKTTSSDKGETWSAPEKTPIRAASTSSNLFRLADGRLLLTLDENEPTVRTPLVMRISTDEGATWTGPVTLAAVRPPEKRDIVWGRQVTYPSVAQLADGTVLVVWVDLSISDAEQWGDIKAARIRVP